MNEDDLVAIFGQQVESDAVKGKREELTIGEFDGALKRQKIKAILLRSPRLAGRRGR